MCCVFLEELEFPWFLPIVELKTQWWTLSYNILDIVEGNFILEDGMTLLVVWKSVSLESVPYKVAFIVLDGDDELTVVVKNAIPFGSKVNEVFSSLYL